MKIRNTFYFLCLSALSLSSCQEDFLKRDTGVTTTKEQVFADPKLAAQFADRTYTFMVQDYFGLGSVGQPFRGTIAEFTDEAVCGFMDEP